LIIDLLVSAYFELVAWLYFGHVAVWVFLGSTVTVEDFPSIIFMTLPSVDGFTKIGLGYSYSSFC